MTPHFFRPTEPAPRPPLATTRAVCALILFGLALGACDESTTGPRGALVAAETGHGALSLDLRLPDPEHPAVVHEMEDATAEALNAWHRSWQVAAPEGRTAREALYPTLSDAYAAALEGRTLAEEIERLGRGVAEARSLDGEALPPAVERGIRRSGVHWERARIALQHGEARRAAENLLRGSDALREVGAEAVARTLVADAAAELRRIPADASYDRQELERARRLVQGGRFALEQGAWELAIRRAYYARGILSGGT